VSCVDFGSLRPGELEDDERFWRIPTSKIAFNLLALLALFGCEVLAATPLVVPRTDI